MEKIANKAFKDELEKIATPKWIKMFRKGLLSEKAVAKIIKASPQKRWIKYLGSGGTQHSNLVTHPKFGENGLAVAKTFQIFKRRSNGEVFNAIDNLPEMLKDNAARLKAFEYLKKISKGEGQISHILGKENGVGYFKYIKGNDPYKIVNKKLDRIGDVRKEMERRLALIGKKEPISDALKDALWSKRTLYRDVGKSLEKNQYAIADEVQASAKFDTKTEKILKKFMKKYPQARDFRVGNTIDGKLIDFDPFIPLSGFVPQTGMSKAKDLLWSAASNINKAVMIGGIPSALLYAKWKTVKDKKLKQNEEIVAKNLKLAV